MFRIFRKAVNNTTFCCTPHQSANADSFSSRRSLHPNIAFSTRSAPPSGSCQPNRLTEVGQIPPHPPFTRSPLSPRRGLCCRVSPLMCYEHPMIGMLFSVWCGQQRLNLHLRSGQINVRLRQAVGGGKHPRRISFFASLLSIHK